MCLGKLRLCVVYVLVKKVGDLWKLMASLLSLGNGPNEPEAASTATAHTAAV